MTQLNLNGLSNYPSYQTISDVEFQTLFEQRNPTEPFLVVFTADWLGEGAIMDSIVSKLADHYKDVFHFFRLDVDGAPHSARQMSISRLPALYFFKNGEIADYCHGMISMKKLGQKVDALLLSGALVTSSS